MNTLSLTAANGRTFAARILRPGDKYGRDGIHGPCEIGPGEKPQVEFFDLTHKFTPYAVENGVEQKGQFTGGRYYVETILPGRGGVYLQGGEPAWTIDAATMAQFRGWITAQMVLDAVKEAFPAYLDLDQPEHGPKLMEPGWDGTPFTIVWEEGPYEWTFRFPEGGVDEELTREGAEFGLGTVKTKPVTVPAGVYLEPVTSYSLGIYPEWL